MENQGNRKCPWEKMTGSSHRKEKQVEANRNNAETVNQIMELLSNKEYSVKEANEILLEVNKRISLNSKVNCSDKLFFD